ncbi:MAG: hypothetical protein AAGG11_22280 [Pseudomonadota bacterium]
MGVDSYGMAWIVVFSAGLATLGCWFLLTRPVPWPWLRTSLRCVVAAWLLLPAPVPGYDGQYAPAFIVALFEFAFQKDGAPQEALQILGIGTAVVLALLLLAFLLARGRRSSVHAAAAGETPDG